MAALYADENVPADLVEALVRRGHDVLTAHADGRANQKVADPDVLARAAALGRAILSARPVPVTILPHGICTPLPPVQCASRPICGSLGILRRMFFVSTMAVWRTNADAPESRGARQRMRP
jgi:hypothetical protein